MYSKKHSLFSVSIVSLVCIIVFTALSACMKPAPFEPLKRTGFPDYADEVYIINSLAETISVIDAQSLTVHNNVAKTGTWPNHITMQGSMLYVVNSGNNSISLYDENTLSAAGTIAVGQNSNPWMAAFWSGHAEMMVPNLAANNVAVIDAAARTVTRRIPVGHGPEGCAIIDHYCVVGNTAYDSSTWSFGQGTVSVIDMQLMGVVKTIPVHTNPQGVIAFPNRNEIHVICTGNYFSEFGTIDIIDTTTWHIIASIAIGGNPSGGYAIDPLKEIVYLGGSGVSAYNYATRQILYNAPDHYLKTGYIPSVAFDPYHKRLFTCNFGGDSITVINTETYATITTLPVSDGPNCAYFQHE